MYDHDEDILPVDSKARKEIPLYSGLFAYFPRALVAVAEVSMAGMKQHKTNGWDRAKSPDHKDCELRHLLGAGKIDKDGKRHSAKRAWRALADLEVELEAAAGKKKR